jgi:ATP-dependent Zn protease
VDEEMRSLVLRGYETARQLLSRHPNAVAALAEELLEVESLDAEAIRALIAESEQPVRIAAREGLS